MVQLIARKPLVYAGKRIAVGGTFNAHTARDAFLLVDVVKSADRVPPETDEALPPEPEPAAPKPKRGRPRREDTSPTEKKKRTYKRRDLHAEP